MLDHGPNFLLEHDRVHHYSFQAVSGGGESALLAFGSVLLFVERPCFFIIPARGRGEVPNKI